MGPKLITSKLKTKRSKAMTVLLLPVFACMFLLGWVMYWVGDSASPQKNKHTKAKPVKDNITIGVIPLEENQEILAN